MKIETQPQENCTVNLTIEVDDERVQPAMRAAARRMSRQYRIPGFRPGKAPYETVLRHIGEGAIFSEAIEELGQKVYEDALDQEKIEAFAPGQLTDMQRNPLVLHFSVPLPPEVKLGPYRDLRVAYDPAEVPDEAIQETLERLREQQAEVAPVDRPAQIGDVVTLNAKGYLNEGENPSDFLLADENVSLALEEAADWPVPGFASQIVGMAAGELRAFDLTFPDDYANASLRGQLAHFDVTVKEVKQRAIPEWSDDVAKAAGDYESLEDLRAKVRADLLQLSARGKNNAYVDKVVGQLVEQASVKYPPVLLEQELDHMLADVDRRLHEQRMTLDDYLKIQGKTKEQYREEMAPQAQNRLKRSLVLGKVINLEKLAVADDEVEAQIDRMSTPWGAQAPEMRKALSSESGRQMVSLDLLTDKAIERLTAIAKGEVVAEAPEDGSRAEEAPAETSGAAEAEPVAEARPAEGEAQPEAEAMPVAEAAGEQANSEVTEPASS